MSKIYKVSGMTCGGCAKSVTRAIQRVAEGVTVEVSHEAGEARVEGPHEPADIKRAVEDAGFEFGGAS